MGHERALLPMGTNGSCVSKAAVAGRASPRQIPRLGKPPHPPNQRSRADIRSPESNPASNRTRGTLIPTRKSRCCNNVHADDSQPALPHASPPTNSDDVGPYARTPAGRHPSGRPCAPVGQSQAPRPRPRLSSVVPFSVSFPPSYPPPTETTMRRRRASPAGRRANRWQDPMHRETSPHGRAPLPLHQSRRQHRRLTHRPLRQR
jgi:hypothetical protein